jgi:uncharacterized membrane protein YkoI
MMKHILTAAALAALAMPAAAQSGTGVTGQTQASSAARVDVKVDQSLANTARVSADSAYAIARANANDGEVSSAELETKGGRLIYNVKVLNKSKRASTVHVDAMTGEVVKAKEYGGLKSTLQHHKENKKLLDAKRDSAARNP